MKANEAPEKLYIDLFKGEFNVSYSPINNSIEYVHTDAFMKKACEFWKDHLDGYDICEDDIERSVESFKLAMKL